jgi:hypothetical protein
MNIHKIYSLFLLFPIDWVAARAKMRRERLPDHKAHILAKTDQTLDGMKADEWRLGGTDRLGKPFLSGITNTPRGREIHVNFMTKKLRACLASGAQVVPLHEPRRHRLSKNHLKADPMPRHGRAARDEEGFQDARNVAAD